LGDPSIPLAALGLLFQNLHPLAKAGDIGIGAIGGLLCCLGRLAR